MLLLHNAIACVYFISHFRKTFPLTQTRVHQHAHTYRRHMPSSTSFHVGICTFFSCFFFLPVYGRVCVWCLYVDGNFVILFGFLLFGSTGWGAITSSSHPQKVRAGKPPQNNENWFCYFAYFTFPSWLRLPSAAWALGGGFYCPPCYCCFYCIYLAAGKQHHTVSHLATQPPNHRTAREGQPERKNNQQQKSVCCWWRWVLSHKIQNVNTGSVLSLQHVHAYILRKPANLNISAKGTQQLSQLPKAFTNMVQIITWAWMNDRSVSLFIRNFGHLMVFIMYFLFPVFS